jgi:cyclophilin family peptidyl-prolyl cis-trans isomerase
VQVENGDFPVRIGLPLAALVFIALASQVAVAAGAAAGTAESPQDVLARSANTDWRPLDPENTLYLELASGRVVLELAPSFAPQHVANIKLLVRQHYFDGLAILRLQDNYVAQWGDPDDKRDLGAAAHTLPPEFYRSYRTPATLRPLPDGDVYAPQVGLIDSWPVARNPKARQEWLTHCYGMLGVGRDTALDSGSGAELYVVIGHAPRQLDRNVTLVGRVVQGIELLSSLPRGTGKLGFYEDPKQYLPIDSLRLAADLPSQQRTELEVLRSDAPIFADYIGALRSRKGAWFAEPTNRIELCNVRVPVRSRAPAAARIN